MATDISSASDDHTGGPAKDAGSPSPHADSAAPQAEQDSTATPGGMMRSSMVMAVGTMVSRVTGVLPYRRARCSAGHTAAR